MRCVTNDEAPISAARRNAVKKISILRSEHRTMAEELPLYGHCPGCSGTSLNAPVAYEDGSWMTCATCGADVVTWPVYKQRALNHAAQNLRWKTDAGRREGR